MKSVIEVENLHVFYGKKLALDGINLKIPPGVIAGIIGPNGSGKSTLIKSLMNLVPRVSGEIKMLGTELKNARKRISYVPQRESVDWDYPVSVFDVILMGRYQPGRLFFPLSSEDRKIAEESLARVGLTEYRDTQIGQLSGGQQQRVFLARALAQRAELYLMDEPFAGVDASTEKAITELMIEMKSKGQSIVLVHHDLASVRENFDYLGILKTKLIAAGPTSEVFTSENLIQAYGGNMRIMQEL
jgi:manganese/zinc/iron transport system ATP- binding protein